VPLPAYSGCDQTNFSAKKKVTIDPGVYCGGMQFNANADVTFNPGVYVVDGGNFTVNGGGNLQGSGVTIVFTSSTMSDWPTATINGGATINLTRPRPAPWPAS
jgi:lipoprotein-anchoring transpeptidase ErfK/SrfK